MRRKIIYCLIPIIITLLILIGLIGYPKIKQWVGKKEFDNTIVPISTQIVSVEDGLSYATKRASEWSNNLYLINLQITFIDREAFLSDIGNISYWYTAINKGLFRTTYDNLYVEIDPIKNAIVEFRAFSSINPLIYEPLDMSQWKMDYKSIKNLISEYVDINMLYNSPTNRTNLLMFQGHWVITISQDTGDYIESEVWIDPIKKEVTRIDCRDESGELKRLILQRK